MRLFIRLVLILVVVAALGAYFGWFHIGTESSNGKSTMTFTVNKDKVEEDKDKVMSKAQDLAQDAQSHAAAAVSKNKPPATQPVATPAAG